MANPQAENGHTDIANETVEALARIRISGEESQCLWVILRKTYGWHKKKDRIALSQFCLMTSMTKQAVSRALQKLSSKKIIAIIKNDDSQNNTYSFNKNLDEWRPLPKKITVIKKDKEPSSKKITVIKKDKEPSSKKIKGVIKKDKEPSSKMMTTKETNTKETNTKETNTKENLTKGVIKNPPEKLEISEIFEKEFWPIYPARNGKKLGKKEAKIWFTGNLTLDEASRVITATKNYAASGEMPRDAIRFLAGKKRDRDWDWDDWVEAAQGCDQPKQKKGGHRTSKEKNSNNVNALSKLLKE